MWRLTYQIKKLDMFNTKGQNGTAGRFQIDS